MARSLRIVFAGTPDFASRSLAALLGSRHRVAAVYTQPDRAAGRGRKPAASAVKRLALEAGIPVLQPPTLRGGDTAATLAALQPHVMVVAAYGLLLPGAVLDTPVLGCINVHASLLPRWRGAAPIQRAILAGDEETGISIMQMDRGLDTGPVLQTARCMIAPGDTGGSLHDRLAGLGARTLLDVLDALAAGRVVAVEQDDAHATYAARLEKSEAVIDWSADATCIERRVRAFNPWPVAESTLRGDKPLRMRIWDAKSEAGGAQAAPGTVVEAGAGRLGVATGEGRLLLSTVQRDGGRPLPVGEFLKANRVRIGQSFTQH